MGAFWGETHSENTENTIVLQTYNLEMRCDTQAITSAALTLEITDFGKSNLGQKAEVRILNWLTCRQNYLEIQ